MAGDITTIARPYAEAVFARARETNGLDAWSEVLALLAAIVADEQLARLIANPNVPRERVRDAIVGVAGSSLSLEAENFVRVLAENNRLQALPEISRLFDELRAAQQGVRQVLVRSAYAMSAEDQQQLADTLRRHLGGQVELSVEEDPELIGGVEVRAGDLVIDGSVRGKLQKLANELQF
jgi:F-type H+-transporting ATPase subunit delta